MQERERDSCVKFLFLSPGLAGRRRLTVEQMLFLVASVLPLPLAWIPMPELRFGIAQHSDP